MLKNYGCSLALASIGLFCIAVATPVQAQQPALPPGVIEAEGVKDWDKAISIYKEALKTDPKRYDLWLRIADIEAARNQPGKAEDATRHALDLRPNDLKLLKKQAQLATWAKDSDEAKKIYRSILKKNPKDYESMLSLGTLLSWDGKTNEAINLIEPYSVHRPKDKGALLLLSQLYMWNGDTEKSSATLEKYKKVAGADKEYKKIKMKLLANANEPSQTVEAADDVIKSLPHDCDAFTSKAVALGALRQPTQMLETLHNADTNCSDKTATGELGRRLTTPLRSDVRGTYDYSTDSDTIRISTFTLAGRYKVIPEYYVLLGGETRTLKAAATSGLATVSGGESINSNSVWAGVEKMFNNIIWLNGRLGYHEAGGGDQTTVVARGGAEYRSGSSLKLNYDINHDFYAVSPLALSKGIKLTDNQLLASWQPGFFATTIDAKANYGFFSDDNQYWTALIAPHRNVISGQKLNVDLGVSGQFTGFSKTLSDGYYSPRTYKQFLVNVSASYVFTADNTFGFVAGTGYNKDNTMPKYTRSNNYAMDANFGLYKDWMLNAHAGHADSVGINSRQYRINNYNLSLTSRF